MLHRCLHFASTRIGMILLLGAVCVLLYNIHIDYRLKLEHDLNTGDLVRLQVGFLLAIAMLVRDRWVFFGCVVITSMAWAAHASYVLGYTPMRITTGILTYSVLGYGWMLLCVRWMGWPRAPEQQVVTMRDLYRFMLFGLLLVPVGHAVLTLLYSVLYADAQITTNMVIQTLFERFFGIIVLTLPLVLGWTERHRPAVGGQLRWPVLPLLAVATLLSVWVVRHLDDNANGTLLLTDYRIALLTAVGWCIVYLRLPLAMALLSMALFVMVSHLGSTAQVERPVGFFNLLHQALETGIVLIALMYYAILSRDRTDMTRQLARQAMHNTLTGLPNLRALRRAGARLSSGTLGCLLLDWGDSLRVGYALDTHVNILKAVAHEVRRYGVEPYQLSNTELALLPSHEETDWVGILHNIEQRSFSDDGRSVRLLPYLGVTPFGGSSGLGLDAALVLASSLVVEARRRHEVEPLHADGITDTLEQMQGNVHITHQALALLRQPGGLVLYFQPIISLGAQTQPAQISGEVLCRLDDGSGTLLTPAQFLSAIEAARRGPELDLAVVTALFEQLRGAPELVAGCARISINLTGQSLTPESFRVHLLELLDNAPLPLSKLCFEITESVSFYSAEHAEHLLRELRKRGCQIAIDDFGVGMQSFSRLKELLVDIIKIDGSFVRNITSEYRDYAMVEASVSIARACRAEVVAEFVEDEATATCLRELGVQWGQGYLYGHPMPLLEGLRAPSANAGWRESVA